MFSRPHPFDFTSAVPTAEEVETRRGRGEQLWWWREGPEDDKPTVRGLHVVAGEVWSGGGRASIIGGQWALMLTPHAAGRLWAASAAGGRAVEAAAIAWHNAQHADSPAFVAWRVLAPEIHELARLRVQRLAAGAEPADRADRVALDVLRALGALA